MRSFPSRYLHVPAALLALLFASCASGPAKTASAGVPAAGYSKPPETFCAELPASIAPAPPEALSTTPGFAEYSAAVADPHGSPLVGLKASDFIALTPAGPRPIVWFHEAPEAPATIAILVDTSGSMAQKLPIVRAVLTDFLAKVDPCDELFLIAFTSRPFLLQPMTTDHALVASRLPVLHSIGATNIFKAISASLEILKHGHYRRRALLLFTDGIDGSIYAATYRWSKWNAHSEHRAPFYVIGIGDHQGTGMINNPFDYSGDGDRVDAQGLYKLAKLNGGQAFIVTIHGNGFANAVASVEAQFNPDYTIGVVMPVASISSTPPIAPSASTPATRDETSFSALRLTVANHPNAVVVTTQVINSPRP